MTAPVEATSFTTASVREALERAGLLAGVRGDLPERCDAVTDDSRRAAPGSMFVAVRGSQADGHDYLAAAERAGASCALVEIPERTSLPALVVRDGRRAAAVAASAAYGDPYRQLTLVGVTGTNGKTTTVNILRHLLDAPRARAASIGTLGVLLGSEGEEVPGGSGLTTPGPVELQRVLRELVTLGVRWVAMEVSSHALEQRRVEGLPFGATVFTNLTRDHLDYHGSMDAYRAAKAELLSHLAPDGAAVVNADDPAWAELAQGARRATFSTRLPAGQADVVATGLRFEPRGSRFTLDVRAREGAATRAGRDGRADVLLPLIGEYNVANALGAAGAAWTLGMDAADAAQRLSKAPQVPGRLEVVHDAGATVLRDYAHTPDALERALSAVRPFVAGRLLVVFGAGGDRDRGKRPEMGAVAERLADVAIVTSDNPRTEDPARILDDIEAGMRGDNRVRFEDRREAIRHALAVARPGDVVVLAGKGHETYQIRGTERLDFDERRVVAEEAAALAATDAGGTR